MITITLPNGTQKTFSHPITVAEVAASIGPALAKAAVAAKVNDRLVDTFYCIEHDAKLVILTAKDSEGLEVLRHSTAHLLAQAVKELYPETQITIGPVIENGFYYDFSRKKAFTEDDLPIIEKRMQAIAQRGYDVTRQLMTRSEAIKFFDAQGEEYKVKIIEAIDEKESLTFYKQGDFIDLCRGPHVPNTTQLGAFKLTKLAGAYWRGDSNNEMLHRIYGTAWPDKKSLKAYLARLEEAKKRDHRVLAKKMDLFHLQPEAPGMVFWHPKGWTLFRTIEGYIRQKYTQFGYQEIRTPLLADHTLWEKSGHWDKYHADMFITESEHRCYAIKPMNCPCHVQVFNQGIKSYRDLPVRLGEFGCCHRNEASGTLHGLMRVRQFTQDDGHIFCTEDQIEQEIAYFLKQAQRVYSDFGFTDIAYRLSTRPKMRVGSDSLWDKAEQALERVLNHSGVDWTLQPGDGAFYGPKIDFYLKDTLERIWQCGTAQLDFSMPARLQASYIDEHGEKQVPVMIHRAICGSLERFIGVLIEHYAGLLPLWLSPIQVVVLNITDGQADYAQKVAENLKKSGIKCELDLRNEKIGFKIREHTIARVPYIVIIGDEERAGNKVSVRTQNGVDLGSMSLDSLIACLTEEIEKGVCARDAKRQIN